MRRIVSVIFGVLLALYAAHCSAADIKVEAIPGEPFGIGSINVRLSPEDANAAKAMPRLMLTEASGRVHYPAIQRGKVREILGGLLSNAENVLPGQATAYFLFTGDEPLRLTFYTPQAHTVVVTPRAEKPRTREKLVSQWWREYQKGASDRAESGQVPPLVDAYLTAMLSRRLSLPLDDAAPEVSLPEKTLDLLMGVEKLRAETLRQSVLASADDREVPSIPLPADTDWSRVEAVAPPAGVVIEPLASHVPMECFYVRFGKFSNYLWFDNLTDEYGGSLANMLALRGHDLHLSQKSQTQLSLRKNKLTELLGDTVISDVALIGRDIYTHEGAALGMLFQASNTRLLGSNLTQSRAAILKEEAPKGAKIEALKIAGHDVTFLSTPDNRLRSFYAVDGDYHFITTSRAMVERFYSAGAGHGALGGTPEFHQARRTLPLERQDVVFVYFSSAMFKSLVEPKYQVELSRRLKSITDIEWFQLARLTAAGEGKKLTTTEELIAAGYLPRGFGKRHDGSQFVVDKNGKFADSARGSRGSYLPVPDVETKLITRAEAARLEQLSQYLRREWKDMDPLLVGIRRSKLNDQGLERLNVEAHLTMLGETKYGWLVEMLGSPATARVLPTPGDVIHAQAFVKGTPFIGDNRPHHLFVGLRDQTAVADLGSDSFLDKLGLLRSTPGYLAAWPRPGILDALPLGLGGTPDKFGFAQLPLGLWRRTVGPWSALSFDPKILAQTTEQFATEETNNPAQVRLHAGDIASSKLRTWVDTLYYQRARQTSVANAALMQHLVQQFQVPTDNAKTVAEELIDGELFCVLGGKYAPLTYRAGATLWQSDAWTPDVDRPPASYRAAPLNWFRGLDADLTKTDGHVMLRAQLDMQRAKPEAEIKLPAFELPNIFGDFGKTSKPKTGTTPPPVPKPMEPAPKPREF